MRSCRSAGIKVVADGALFAAAGIPTVYHGPVGTAPTATSSSSRRGARPGGAVYVAMLQHLWAA